MLDARDTALQSACPTVAMPRFGPAPEIAPGQRVLVAANGLFLQVKTAWLECQIRIGNIDIPLHYGQAQPFIHCAFGKIPQQPLREFVHWAREALPNEVAGGLAYSTGDGALRLVRFEPLSQSPHHVAYRIPPLRTDEVLAMDLHSHGHDAAFFSATDDADDMGIKIAGVFGHLDRAAPSSRFRLVAGQLKLDLPSPQDQFSPAGGSSWNIVSTRRC